MTDYDRPTEDAKPIHALQRTLRQISLHLKDFWYGMTYFEMDMTLRKEKSELEHLFMLISFGDLIGLPILPPYYSLRLLPFIVPLLQNWKRRLLREKDLTDIVGGGG